MAAARAVGERGVVWAVDMRPESLSRVRTVAHTQGLTHVEILCGDAALFEGSGLPDACGDVALVHNMLFTLEDKSGVVAEVARVLKPGGRAAVIDWAGSFGGIGPHTDHLVGSDEMRALFEEQGFAYVEDLPVGAYHWGFVVRKKS